MSVRDSTAVFASRPFGGSAAADEEAGQPDAALLDVAAAALVADPSASLAAVASAAGIGRTTLHARFATRHDLLVAVADRAFDLCDRALAGAASAAAAGEQPGSEPLERLIGELVSLGCHLAFLLRQPEAVDHPQPADRVERLVERVAAFVRGCVDVPDSTPNWWLATSLHALVYTAWDAVGSGWLAPRDAPGLVAGSYLNGVRTDRTGGSS